MSVTRQAHAELTAHLVELGRARARLGEILHPLLDRALTPSSRPDSHRTVASGGTVTHHGTPPAEDPDDPTTWSAPSISDRTGEAAIARPARDPVTAGTRKLLDDLDRLTRELAELADRAEHVANPDGDRRHHGNPDAIWCTSCLRTGHCEPRRPGGYKLCRWCDDFQRLWRRLPPQRILERRQAGQRIYDRDIRAAIDDEKPGR
jgi:hypothetical protein